MSNENEQAGSDTENQNAETQQVSELDMLKQRARLMGVEFSNNIGLETLKQRIQAKMDGTPAPAAAPTPNAPTSTGEQDEAPAPILPMGTVQNGKPVKKMTLRQYMINEQMKLVRLRITNLDPKKKDLHGEIITVANEHLGTVKKFVPFGEVTENGYHVPYCIYVFLKARKFLNIRVRKVHGKEQVDQIWAQEFALEVLPPLTPDEIAKLAAAQTAGGSTL